LKTAEQERARELRAQGWSVQEIERELEVARSSVSLWVRDVHLDTDARARLAQRSHVGPSEARERRSDACRELRRLHQQVGRNFARERGPNYGAGCMLYWAEGAKRRNTVKITNSDPEVLRFFASFLRAHFNVPSERMSVYCNLFADHVKDQEAIEGFWLEVLGLDRSSLRKTVVNTYSKYSQKKRMNKLPYGTTALVVHSTEIVQTIYGSIQEYGGFDRPEWLD
jgi:hypothetical protein